MYESFTRHKIVNTKIFYFSFIKILQRTQNTKVRAKKFYCNRISGLLLLLLLLVK